MHRKTFWYQVQEISWCSCACSDLCWFLIVHFGIPDRPVSWPHNFRSCNHACHSRCLPFPVIRSQLCCLAAVNKHHGRKQLGDGSICILQTRSSGGRLKTGTKAGSVEECCLLAHFPAGVYLTFYLMPDLLDQLWLHTQWAEPSHINQQSIKCHTDLQQTNVMETLSHWNPLLGGYVSSCQADRNKLAHHRTSLVVLKLGFELGLSLSLEFTVLAPVPTPPWCWDPSSSLHACTESTYLWVLSPVSYFFFKSIFF